MNRRAAEPVPLVEYLLLGACASAVLAGFADVDRAPLFAARVAALAFVPAVLVVQGLRAPDSAVRRGRRLPLWVPASTMLAAVAVQAGGGPGGSMLPAAMLAAGAAGLSRGPARGLLLGLALILTTAAPALLGWSAPASPAALSAYALGVLACALVPGWALEGERRVHAGLRSRLRALERETGGLLNSGTIALPELSEGPYGDAERDRDRRSVAAELQRDIERACTLLLSATGADFCGVYRPDDDDPSVLVAVATAGEVRGLVREVGARDGIFGAAWKAGTPVCLRNPGPGDTRVVHRHDGEGLGAVLVLPLADGEERWGVVVLDARDADVLEGRGRDVSGIVADLMSRLVARAAEVSALREGMRENHAFYEACRLVSRHVRIQDIAAEVVESAGAFVQMDGAALALLDETGRLRVVAGAGFANLPASPFPVAPGEGLLAQAIRHRTLIERRNLEHAGVPPVLFGREAGAESGLTGLLVLPILAPGAVDQPLGALVVARRGGQDFTVEDGERLAVLLAQAGASISNGRLFAEHEERGITDGMTGLPNHRRFQEVLAQKIAAAGRTGRRVSLLLMDIDRFKSVNDTYGHPMGDEVIRRLAGVLAEAVRDGTDLAARYGGEEFCAVLEDTDAHGAAVLADRIRESFKREVFVHREGSRPVTFRCSVSIGVSCWPDDAQAPAELVDKADQALYLSKEGGRDRVTPWSRALKASA